MNRAAALALLLALSAGASAEERPEWELGLGATAFTLPDYRGSDESRGYVLPFPYLVYRGERFRVDRQGLRGVFFESERVQLNLSISGTPPVDSDDNRARQGMPHLDPTLEIGPRLDIALAGDRTREWALEFRLPVRAVIATDFSHVKGAGYLIYPHLSLVMRPVFAGGRWNLGLQAGPVYATRRYHEYFYGVDEQFATPEREAYEAGGGYSGATALASLSRRWQRYWIGAFLRYDSLKGATFESSPLVKRDYSLMAGIAFAVVFTESSRKVDVKVED